MMMARGRAFLVAALLALAGPCLAQTTGAGVTAAPTILTLDQDRLYAQSLFGKRLEQTSAEAVAKLAAENRQIEADLAAEEKTLTDQRATLSASDFKPLAEAFDAKVERIRAEQAAKSKAIQEARDAGRKAFIQTALPVLTDLMRQRGALALLNKAAVILAFDQLDVTDAAIAAIDAKLGDGSTPPPPAPAQAPAPTTPTAPGP
jgi:Skp family chaperone for outer membrane proteins